MKHIPGVSSLLVPALIPAAMIVLLTSGCSGFGTAISGSGRPATKTYDLSGFTRVSAGSAFQVELTQGAQFHVEVTVDDNLTDHLKVETSGSTLKLHMAPNLSLRNVTLSAKVTMPELAGLDLSGATTTTVSGFQSEKPLSIELSGASHIKGAISAGDCTMEISGASHAQLRGKVKKLSVKASGASEASLGELDSADTVANASGASRIETSPFGIFDGDASGASSIRYGGKPTRVDSHSSGAGSVKPK